MNEEMSLTFSARNNPGVYALLLGSGISADAGVPTGNGVLKDLIQQLSTVKGEDLDADPYDWYRDTFDKEPRFDEIISDIGPNPAERRSLLEDYFEPTSEEREQGIKTPSVAHESIAWLVDEGYVKAIITTNFDRLLEKALNKRGITPTVISTPTEAEGAAPLMHEDVVILKVNGDYKDLNLKITEDELKRYDKPIKEKIDRVLNEFGLIVCGWSAKYDTALRESLLGSDSRRYSTFWAHRGSLNEYAEKITGNRKTIPIEINGASQFFEELKENIQALEGAEAGAPLTREIARERVKKYLPNEQYKIKLSDLLQDETERVYNEVFDEDRFPLQTHSYEETVDEQLELYEQKIQILLNIMSIIANWGPEVPNSAISDLSKSISRLGSPPAPEANPFKTGLNDLRKYPASILIYGIGVAALESRNWKLLECIFSKIEVENSTYVDVPIILETHPWRIGDHIPDGYSLRLKKRIKRIIRGPSHEFIKSDDRFDQVFSEFECLSDLILCHIRDVETDRGYRVPSQLYDSATLESLKDEVQSEGENWGPLDIGLFDGSSDRLIEIIDDFEEEVSYW